MLNLGRLRLLHELSVLGTISAVADAVHLTRPAVSKQLALLEEELQIVLIERSGRNIQLTPAARRLVTQVANLFEIAERIEAEVAAVNMEVSGEIRMSAFASMGGTIVPLAIRRMLEEHPRLNIEFIQLEASEGLRAAAAKQTDLAIVNDWVNAEALANALEFHPLCTDNLDAVLSSTHKLADRKTIRLSDLASERWTLNRLSEPYYTFLMNACLASGFTPKVTSSTNAAVALEMVRAGLPLSQRSTIASLSLS